MNYSGNEHITANGSSIDNTVADFWRWSYGDLSTPTARQAFSEFLVASSLGISGAKTAKAKFAKKPYDILFQEDDTSWRIDVKSSAYCQSQDEEHPNHISFRVSADGYCDVLVFCVYKGLKSSDTPLNTDLWEFYSIPASVVNAVMPEAQTITLQSLMKLEPIWSDFFGVKDAITKVMEIKHNA